MKDKIINLVIDNYGIDKDILLKRTRKLSSVEPRHVAMYLLRIYVKDEKGFQMPFQQIADIFDLKHDTVMHGCRRVENDFIYKEFNKRVTLLMNEIEQAIDFENEKNTRRRKLWERIGIKHGYIKMQLPIVNE